MVIERSARRSAALTWGTCCLLLASVADVFAEVGVTALVDRNQAQVGEQILLTLVVTSAKSPSVQVPPSLSLSGASSSGVQGPATSQEMSVINGRLLRRTTIEYAYYLTLQRAGVLTISPIPVVVDGSQYSTQPIQVQVGKSAVAGAGGTVQVRVNISRASCYQGEPIVVEFHLFEEATASQRVQSRQLTREPSFSGFWVETLTDIRRGQSTPTRETVNGVAYNVLPMLRYIVFPTRAGTLTIPSATVTLVAAMPTGARNFWGEPVLQARQIAASSPERTLEVRPLPANAPVGFSGAVGSFAITSTVDKTEVAQGDPVTWKITISGNGNVKSIGDLPIPDLSAFRAYAPKTATTLASAQSRAEGRLVYERVVMPLHSGVAEIPAVVFSFFDPKDGRYKTVSTEPHRISVKTGPGGQNAIVGFGGGQSPVKQVGSDIRFIQPDVSVLHDETANLFHEWWYWSLYAIPLGAFFGVLGLRLYRARLGADPARLRALGAAGEARKRLKTARDLLDRNDVARGVHAIENALTELVAGAADLSAAGLTSDTVSDVLRRYQVPDDLAQNVLDVLTRCDRIRYAPSIASPDEAREIYEISFTLIRQLLKYLVP